MRVLEIFLVILVFGSVQSLAVRRASPPVKVEIFAMSRCPDCASFVDFFSPVVEDLAAIMNMTMDYVCSVSSETVSCMHGEGECEGNKYELCAQAFYPKNWFDLVECMDMEYSTIPSNVKDCCQKVGMDFSTLDTCKEKYGDELLLKSAQYTIKKGVNWAPTIFLNGQEMCEWHGSCFSTDVTDWEKKICDLYQGSSKPSACS